jgi:hypothetical protein
MTSWLCSQSGDAAQTPETHVHQNTQTRTQKREPKDGSFWVEADRSEPLTFPPLFIPYPSILLASSSTTTLMALSFSFLFSLHCWPVRSSDV